MKFSPLDLSAEQVRELLGSGTSEATRKKRTAVGQRFWVREEFWSNNDTCDHEYCSGCDMGSMLDGEPDSCEIQYCATPEAEKLPVVINAQTIIPASEDDKQCMGQWWLSPSDNADLEDLDAMDQDGVWWFARGCGFMGGRSYFTRHERHEMPYWASRIHVEVTEVNDGVLTLKRIETPAAKSTASERDN